MDQFTTFLSLGIKLWLYSYVIFISCCLWFENFRTKIASQAPAYPFISFSILFLSGLFSNTLVKMANDWSMPTTYLRLADNCFIQIENNVRYCPISPETRLWFLGDIFFIRSWDAVISVGDILLFFSGWISFGIVVVLAIRYTIFCKPSS